MRRRETRSSSRIGLAVVAGAAALFAVHAYALRFTQDDAYISLQYARNLVEGRGLVFNAGERVEGYSNFAWTMFLALLLRLGLPALELARLTGVACAILSIFVAARFAKSIEGHWGPVAAGTAILVGSSSPFALWSTSGMETAFHTLVVTVALAIAFGKDRSPSARRRATWLFVLATLNRPDAPVFFVGWIATRAADVWRRINPAEDSARAIARDVAWYAAPLVPYSLAKMLYYGSIVPNTYYAKTGLGTTYLLRGFGEAKDLVFAYSAVLAAPLLAWMATRHREAGPRLLRLLAVLAVHALYVLAVGGDVLPFFRFWLPILPMTCALVAIGARVAVETFVRPTRRDLAACAVILGVATFSFQRNWSDITERRYPLLSTLPKHVGLWLGERLAPGEAIASTGVGALAYYSGHPVIDMLGLVDPDVARHPDPIEGVTDTWREKKYNAASVLRRRPAAILFSTGVRPSASAEQALFLYEDFHRSYYALYIRPDPRVPQPATIYRLRPDAPAPPDTLIPTPEREFLQHWCRGLIATLRHDDREGALREFELSVRKSPPFFVEALEWWACTRYELGDDGAVPVLRDVLRIDPWSFLASFRLGHYLLVNNELDEAETVFLAHVERNPDEARAWQSLAEISARRGRYEEALDRIDRSLTAWSTNPEAAMLRERLVVALGARRNVR